MKRCPYCAEEIQDEAIKCRYCGAFLTRGKKLHRSKADQKITGLCGGLGEYFNIDPTIVRLLTTVAIIWSGILPGILVYFVFALIIPKNEDE